MQSYELCSDIIDVVIDVSCIYGTGEDGAASAFDEKSASIIKLSNNTVLYLREVNKYACTSVALPPFSRLPGRDCCRPCLKSVLCPSAGTSRWCAC